MRTFHYKRNPDHCPSINVDRLWSLVPEGVYEKTKADSEKAPVIDVTKLVWYIFPSNYLLKSSSYLTKARIFNLRIVFQGYFKVLGKGALPAVPIVVKAKFFSKEVSFIVV